MGQEFEGLFASTPAPSSVSSPTHTPAPPAPSSHRLLSPHIVDNVAKDFELDEQNRVNLHGFAQVTLLIGSHHLSLSYPLQACEFGGGLSVADASTRMAHFALSSAVLQLLRIQKAQQQDSLNSIRELVKDFQARIDKSFDLTKEQNVSRSWIDTGFIDT